MTIRYVLMDPAGNRTILVETPVSQADQAHVAAKLMELEPSAEQVGFLSEPDGRKISLRMSGGEFCGNATMSAAVYCAIHTGMVRGQVTVRASGTPEPVTAEIASEPEGLWRGVVEMPRPRSAQIVRFPDGQAFPVVSFPGISHVILEQELPRKTAEELVVLWCGYLHADALGLMFLDRTAGRLTPLVYVPAADTLFWESACGSGSSAVGVWLAMEGGQQTTVSLRQPGGVLTISASPDGAVFLEGSVQCICERTAEIAL